MKLKNTYLNFPAQQDVKTHDSFSLFQTTEEDSFDSNYDVVLEPLHNRTYEPSYTCLLIPRFPSHQLSGDFALCLPRWQEQICISYGWKLQFVTIDPEYFQWGMQLNVSNTPNHIMQTIRTETSKLILSNFSFLDQDKISDDFWALGYLVVLGIHPHIDNMIARSISLMRRR